jgi:predicted nucleotidyltransferase
MDKLTAYKVAAQHKHTSEGEQLTRRRQQAWDVARRAAAVLKEEFEATRVVLFGSLVHEELFTPWSDVDIAAWGLAPTITFKAVAALIGFDEEIEINLVDTSMCKPTLLATIEREGIEL